jgi:hypothetical protein
MGGNISTPIPVKKQGARFSDILPTLRPFDIVLFSGIDVFSDLIKHVELEGLERVKDLDAVKAGLSPQTEQFSHVGMIVTSDILDDPLVKPGKFYIWESTMSGKLGYGINDIEGHGFLGVQLRNFEQVFLEYDIPNDTSVAIARFLNNPFSSSEADESRCEKIKTDFTKLFHRLNGVSYDYNILDLAACAWKSLRPLRNFLNAEFTGADDWLFCSELIAVTWQALGFLPPTVDPKNVLPMDLIGYDTDLVKKGGLTLCVELPPIRIVSDLHYDV